MPHSFEAIAPDWKMSPERSIPPMPVSIQLEAYKSKQPPTSCKTIPENCIANDFGGRKTKHFMDMNHYSQLHRLLKKRPRASTKNINIHTPRKPVDGWGMKNPPSNHSMNPTSRICSTFKAASPKEIRPKPLKNWDVEYQDWKSFSCPIFGRLVWEGQELQGRNRKFTYWWKRKISTEGRAWIFVPQDCNEANYYIIYRWHLTRG